MHFLKKAGATLVVLLLAGGSWYYVWYFNAPCAKPILYTLGTFDERFGITKKDFLDAVRQAALIWEKPIGKNLFTYSERGTLPINLLYDARQETTQKDQTLEADIANIKNVADSVKQEYSSLKKNYEQGQATYTHSLASYQETVDAYNQLVAYWNARGGAPKSAFDNLSAEKNSLQSMQDTLEQERLKVNALADQINALIDKYNLLVNHVNENVNVINSTAGKEFNEGLYISDANGTRINIYQFQDKAKLIRVLAHELGHALGLEHNGNPESIMYALNQSNVTAPSKDDLLELKAKCNVP